MRYNNLALGKRGMKMNRKKFLEGLRDGLPIALGYLAVSFGIGISCHAAGITALQGFLMSLFNNASAGEYGGITVITENAGVWMMVLMTLIINARYMLMSCALSQKLSPDTPLGVRMLIGFDVTDEVFGIAIAQEGLLNVWYFIGAMCAALPGWSLGTLFGALAGNVPPVWAMNGFSVMLYGMFLAIIMPEGKKNRVVLGCIGVSFVLSALAAKLLPMFSGGMRILLLTIFISAAAAILFPRESPDVDTERFRQGGARGMNTYLYIAVMALTTYAIRVLPLTLIRKPIRSTFLRSFLYYVPYVTLAVMTFPAILTATDSPMIGGLAMLVGIVSAWLGMGLLPVSLLCCGTVLALQFLI